MATYNRSNVMRLAIQSLIRSEFGNWELIVVSDASTDDTEEVISSFQDQRIRFIQLSKNNGSQSIPNNEGIKIAIGRYVAYLNHDDLWFPDHLDKVINCIESTNADWVISQGFSILNNRKLIATSAYPDNRYSPFYGQTPATLWLAKKEVIESLGGWRLSSETVMAPSQDLLIRAYKANYIIISLSSFSAILFPSGIRIDCYKNRDFVEQGQYLEKMVNYNALRKSLFEQTISIYIVDESINSYRLGYLFFRLLVGLTKKICRSLNITPVYISSLLKHKKKGSYIKKLKKIRGLTTPK
jgi:glycosyltransferase involved in cell wall biosynthesis